MTIIGSPDPAHSAILRELYSWAPGRIFETSFRSAEMVKYVCNAWHAVKVAFANEVGTLAKELGVPVPLADRCADLWDEALRRLGDNADHTEIHRFLSER